MSLYNKWSALVIKSGQFYYETYILRYTPLFVFHPVRRKQYLKKSTNQTIGVLGNTFIFVEEEKKQDMCVDHWDGSKPVVGSEELGQDELR